MTMAHAGAGDEIIYYRRPLTDKNGQPAQNAGWITWGDSLSGSKHRDYTRRGFVPLFKYGAINTSQRDRKAFGDKSNPPEEGWDNNRYIWEAILSHPDGPAEFPVDQILTFRWYRPENLPVPDVVFPQLLGVTVKEYRCPERCGRAPFVDIDGAGGARGLSNHLRISHNWDVSSLLAYGDRIGIDFAKADVSDVGVQTYQPEAAAEYLCEQCGKTFKNRIGLAGHSRSHPMVAVEAIG